MDSKKSLKSETSELVVKEEPVFEIFFGNAQRGFYRGIRTRVEGRIKEIMVQKGNQS